MGKPQRSRERPPPSSACEAAAQRTPHTSVLQLASAMARPAVEVQSTRRCLPHIDRLEIELSLAFDEEHTVRGLIAGRRVAIVPTRLHEIGARSKPEFGLSFRSLNVG